MDWLFSLAVRVCSQFRGRANCSQGKHSAWTSEEGSAYCVPAFPYSSMMCCSAELLCAACHCAAMGLRGAALVRASVLRLHPCGLLWCGTTLYLCTTPPPRVLPECCSSVCFCATLLPCTAAAVLPWASVVRYRFTLLYCCTALFSTALPPCAASCSSAVLPEDCAALCL